jgi:hypothetical protein
MSIAVYRHMKLSVALPGIYYNPVSNLSRRLLRGISERSQYDEKGEPITHISVKFTELQRRLGLLINRDLFWEFEDSKLTVVNELKRNGRTEMVSSRSVPPLGTEIWTQDGNVLPVWDQFEEGVPSRVAIERYLHANVKNPWDYIIVTYDFRPAHLSEHGPVRINFRVRSLAETELAATQDTSENAENWMKLFMKEA